MSAHVSIKRYEATPKTPAFMSIRVNDGAASACGTVFIGRPVSAGCFFVHMTHQAFGTYQNVCATMDEDNATAFLIGLLAPLDFSRPRLAVAA